MNCKEMAVVLALLTIVTAVKPCVADQAGANSKQDTGTSSSSSQAQTGSQLVSEQFGPFKFSAGPDTSGAFSANLDGQQEADFQLNNVVLTDGQNYPFYYNYASVGYSADGTWSTDPKTPSNGTISLKPGFTTVRFAGPYKKGVPEANCPPEAASCGTASIWPQPTFGLGGYVDLDYKYGTVQQSTSLQKVKQFNAGAGLYYIAPFTPSSVSFSIIAPPRVSATYYHPVDTTGGALALPTGITANHLQVEFHTTLGILQKGSLGTSAEDYPFELDIKYDGTKSLTGVDQSFESLWKLQLSTALIKLKDVDFSVTYQAGKEGGFSYDKQVILGALVKFLSPGT